MTAAESLAKAAGAALATVSGLNGRYDHPPLQAAFPHAVIEAGPELDWSHKSGRGREVRVTVILRDEGERPTRLRRLLAEAEAALAAVGGAVEAPGTEWRIVSFAFLRSRLVAQRDGRWSGVLDYRARMLAG